MENSSAVAKNSKIAKCLSISLVGLEGHRVEVQAVTNDGLPGMTIVGLPDISLNESRQRVTASFRFCKIKVPFGHTTINLAPASLKKQGSSFDLAIAICLLAATVKNNDFFDTIKDIVFIGELGLDAQLHKVNGVLPMVNAAKKIGAKVVVVPKQNFDEAKLVGGIEVHGAVDLIEAANIFGAKIPEIKDSKLYSAPQLHQQTAKNNNSAELDMKDVLGQESAKNALEIAAAGGHHILMLGPPGTGKTMLASRFPTILPNLTPEQSIEVSSILSLSGALKSAQLVKTPPFESPHHTATVPAIIGGGSSIVRPGSVSRAHHGVLFLDEAPEFSPRVLQTLRQPLESGEVVIDRSVGQAKYPAKFQLILAANPCPCGMLTSKSKQCKCTSIQRARYFSRLSGPLLDRIDLMVNVDNVKKDDYSQTHARTSAQIRESVISARDRAAFRLKSTPWRLNSEVPGSYLRRLLIKDQNVLDQLIQAVDRGIISLRKADRILRVAFTIADLQNVDAVGIEQIGQAMQLKSSYIDEFSYV